MERHTFISTKREAIVSCVTEVGYGITREALLAGLDEAANGKDVYFFGGDLTLKADPATENRGPCFLATVYRTEPKFR